MKCLVKKNPLRIRFRFRNSQLSFSFGFVGEIQFKVFLWLKYTVRMSKHHCA